MDANNGLPQLPQGWVWTRLGGVAYLNPKLTNDIPDELEVSFIPMKHVEELTGRVDLSLTKRYSEVKKGYTVFKNGDVIFAKITPCMENGKVGIVNNLTNGIGFGSTEFYVIRLPNVQTPNRFMFFFLVRESFRRDARMYMTGTAGQLRVPKGYLEEVSFPLPPLPEQQRIVAKIEELLTKLDAGIEALNRIKLQLKQYRQAVLKHAFEGKLTEEWREAHKGELEPATVLLKRIWEERRKNVKGKYKELPPLDTSDLPELPEAWVWTRLEDVILENRIGIVRSARNQNKQGIGFGYVKMDNVTMDGNVLLNDLVYVDATAEEMDQYSLHKGDILFNTRNSVELVGKTGIIRSDTQNIIYNNNLMRIRTSDHVSPLFLVYQMCSTQFRVRMDKIKRATTNVAALYAKDILPLPISMPPLPEQHRIVEEIEHCFSLADGVEKAMEQSLIWGERLRQSILKRAFEGKLVPQDPSDEPAEKLLERISADRAAREAGKKATGRSRRKLNTMQRRLM